MTSGRSILVLCCISYFFHSTYAVPHFVVTSTESSNGKERGNDGASSKVLAVPEIYQMKVNSHITNRFVHNTVTSKVRNHAQKAQEAAFSVILTDNAFISGFVMEIDGKNYTAHVKDKEEAQRDYDRAVARGLSAAQVAATARDSNRFTVSVNLEPETKAAFYLTHEELLKRQDSRYELLINIHPGQPVKDLGVNVLISESKKLINVKAPPLRSGNEIGNEDDELDPRADVRIINDKEAAISFSPSLERQKQLAHSMKTDDDDGLSAQFVVQYDVERDSTCGDVLIRDGYFVHFFAPSGLPFLPKHVVFVLDTSGSMWGTKMEQLQDAMKKILEELHENDMFSLIEFNNNAKVWDLDIVSQSVWYPCLEYDDTCGDKDIATFQFPNAYPANAEYIEKAKNRVSQFRAIGGTNIYDALKVAVHVADREARRNHDGTDRRPSIVFLTDGDATTGITSTIQITNEITQMNSALRKSRLYCLSFGSEVDKTLLHELSLRNNGFSKHIYEGLDVSIQLKGFYKQISDPVLNDVQFKYQPSVKEVTKTDYPVYYDGSEIVVAGSYDIDKPIIDMIVDCVAAKLPKMYKPVVKLTNNNLERLWAYLTIKQLLETKEISDENTDERKEKSLDLALKYSFITPLTSLLVVKPTATEVVDIEDASEIINQNWEETLSLSSIPVAVPSGYSSEVPEIYQMEVNSHINNRFVHNTVTSKVRNHAQKAQEAIFSVILTDNAFISGFVMEIDGKSYTAHVKDKEEAQRDYDRAVVCGLSAAQVAVTARDSNRFTVSVNLEPETKAAFYLTYEELLKRQDSRYELLINIHPGQPVKDLGVNVLISESKKLINVKAPPLRSGNEIGNEDDELDPRADIRIINDKEAAISFSPSLERQKQLAHSMKTDDDDGLSAQFVVQYDVERDSTSGDVLVRDGYFVHFFAPTGLPFLPKHVVLVLDTSGSMRGIEIKNAMKIILEELHWNDTFSLIQFSNNSKVWDLDKDSKSVWYPCSKFYTTCSSKDIATLQFPNAYPANAKYIKKAKSSVSHFNARGGSNIYDALQVAVHVADREARRNGFDRRPFIIFLTDGDATIGKTSPHEITNEITKLNSALRKARLYCLSFGSGVDKKFLHDLSSLNSGFSKHIYEGLDVSLQLKGFYKQISSPLLNDVQFKYQSSVKGLTKTDYPVFYDGSEIVVAGSYDIGKPIMGMMMIVAEYTPKIYEPVVEPTNSNLERLWAYLTIKQLLEPKEISDEDTNERKQKALDLALKYSFITPLTSLLVVKPTATEVVDIEDASKKIINRNCEEMSSLSSIIIPSGYSNEAAHSSTGGGSFIQSILLNVRPTGCLNLNNGNRSGLASDSLMLWLPSGTYKLGLKEVISDHPPCTNSPLNGNGNCTLWYECTQVHSLLTSLDVYVNHFCVLRNEIAGLCCPNVKV